MTGSKKFDVIIIGGSYAGLSSAMALGRSMRDVLVIDSGLPCNRQTPHSHNFITHDGAKPSEITETSQGPSFKI
ncbi:UNVERIFIED_CONTAM: thioredoxin reductase [Pseudacidovorax intermedius]|nr:thioredoxin reductase [Pseudacidovorax intermedius]